MSKRQHGITGHTRECLQAVRKDREARAALQFFVHKMRCSDEVCMAFFVGVVSVCADQERKSVQSSNDSKPRAVLQAAKRISEVAQRINALNKERSWAATNFIPKDEGFIQAVENLPGLLEIYARQLRLRVERLQRQQKLLRQPTGRKPTQPREFLGIHGMSEGQRIGSFHYRAMNGFHEAMQRLTGNMYREKSAAIFRIINPMFGLTSIDADSVRKRARRARGLK